MESLEAAADGVALVAPDLHHLTGTDQVLHVAALDQHLGAGTKSKWSAFQALDALHGGIGLQDSHLDMQPVVGSLSRIGREIQGKLAVRGVALHVLVKAVDVVLQVLLFCLVELPKLVGRHHEADLPSQLLDRLSAIVEVAKHHPLVAMHELVIKVHAREHFILVLVVGLSGHPLHLSVVLPSNQTKQKAKL